MEVWNSGKGHRYGTTCFKWQLLLSHTLAKPPNFHVPWFPHLQNELGAATTP